MVRALRTICITIEFNFHARSRNALPCVHLQVNRLLPKQRSNKRHKILPNIGFVSNKIVTSKIVNLNNLQ
ncbi:unnamed protein product [Cylicocyclus nassatus]|uniref:Uncharacterized protein n=1 Tax=Cylicocyclus nassatus TaxID=53992 RepID=A0AA36M102_CYLNA|nr:unnamed protein product [Cylicocyclus nassatus]